MALVNVMESAALCMGRSAGTSWNGWRMTGSQLLGSSTPVVVLAHMPLWTIDAEWGWGTD